MGSEQALCFRSTARQPPAAGRGALAPLQGGSRQLELWPHLPGLVSLRLATDQVELQFIVLSTALLFSDERHLHRN